MISKRLVLVLVLLSAALLAVSSAFPAGHAAAVPLSVKKAAAQKRVQKIKKELLWLQNNLEATIQQYDLANLKLAAAQKNVDETTLQLQQARYQLQVARTAFTNRVVSIYKQPQLNILDIVMSARSFSDIGSELQSLDDISASDAMLVSTLNNAADAVQQRRTEMVAARASAQDYLVQVQTKKATIDAAIARQKHIFSHAKALVARIEKQIAAEQARINSTNSGVWRDPRKIPPGPWGAGHPEVIPIALKYIGIPYVYGAADPRVGFDCSGLVMYSYRQLGIQLPHYSGYMMNMGTPVPMTALIPGDLVFIGLPVSHHVALYYRPGEVIEAPYTGALVRIGSIAPFQYAVRLP